MPAQRERHKMSSPKVVGGCDPDVLGRCTASRSRPTFVAPWISWREARTSTHPEVNPGWPPSPLPRPAAQGIGSADSSDRRKGSRLADRFGLLSHRAVMDVLRDLGPSELIAQTRAAEASDPSGRRWPRGKPLTTRQLRTSPTSERGASPLSRRRVSTRGQEFEPAARSTRRAFTRLRPTSVA